MAVRWILMNPQLGFRPVGFLDSDPYNVGRHIHGVEIIGGIEKLETILEEKNVDGIVVTVDDRLTDEALQKVLNISRTRGRWVRTLRLEFELVE